MIWIIIAIVLFIGLGFLCIGADANDADMVVIGLCIMIAVLVAGGLPSTVNYLTNDSYIADYEQYMAHPSHHIPAEDIHKLKVKMYRLQTDNRGVWFDGLIPDRVMKYNIVIETKAKEK